MTDPSDVSRRALLRNSSVAALSGAIGCVIGACSRSQKVAAAELPPPPKLPPLLAPSEAETGELEAPLPPEKRMGFAIVGLGHLALQQILPAFAQSKLCRAAALVSGSRDKAEQTAARFGINPKSIYDYQNFDRLADNTDVSVVYIVLPNGMHAEYSVRAAKAGKHVLCEKPMAVSVAECQRMIDASKQAGKKLMIAYRLQYQPHHRELIRMARAGELGNLKGFISSNGQAQGDPKQWRLNKSLAGGGALPDVGIYCVNAARYLSGEEPILASATLYSTPDDARFKEVEEQLDFALRFPSGFTASGSCSYGYHNSKYLRLMGERAWAELSPAFPYQGQQLYVSRKDDQAEQVEHKQIQSKNQFALEMDHFARAIQNDRQPHTPGEEGMQDVRIIQALYEAASSGHVVQLPRVEGTDRFRGPAPA